MNGTQSVGQSREVPRPRPWGRGRWIAPVAATAAALWSVIPVIATLGFARRTVVLPAPTGPQVTGVITREEWLRPVLDLVPVAVLGLLLALVGAAWAWRRGRRVWAAASLAVGGAVIATVVAIVAATLA